MGPGTDRSRCAVDYQLAFRGLAAYCDPEKWFSTKALA